MAELTAELVKQEIVEDSFQVCREDFQPFFSEVFQDREFLLDFISKPFGGSVLSFLPEYYDDREVVLKAVENWHTVFEKVSEWYGDDEEIAKIAVSQHGNNFQYLSERLRGSKEMMFLALHNLPKNEFTDRWVITAVASDELRKDREVINEILKYYYVDIRNIHESLLDDEDFIRDVVDNEEHGDFVIHYASDRLKEDREFVKYAVTKSHYILGETTEELQDDDEIVRLALAKSSSAIQYASDRFKDNKDIILNLVKENSEALQVASNRLKDDIDVVMAAVSKNASAFKYVSKRLQGNKEVVMTAIDSGDCYNILKYTTDELRNDKEVVFSAVVNSWAYEFEYASPSLKADREFILTLIDVLGEYDIVKYISPLLQGSYEIMEAAVASDGMLIQYASENLRDDPEFVKKAMANDVEAIKYASNNVLDNEEVVRMAVEEIPMLFVCASYRLRTNKELIEELMEKNVSILQFVPAECSHYAYFAKPKSKEDVFMKLLRKIDDIADYENDYIIPEDDED